MNKAVFIDKDGTLIHDIPYNVDSEKIRFYPEVPESLQILKEHGFKLIVISNQSGVARGKFEISELKNVQDKMQQLLKPFKVQIDAFYFCPHHSEGKVEEYTKSCNCRKPNPGMILQAAKEHDIDLSNSWMIGDRLDDIEAGRKAGCKTILVHQGHEKEWALTEQRTPTYIVKKVREAATRITYYEKLDKGIINHNREYLF